MITTFVFIFLLLFSPAQHKPRKKSSSSFQLTSPAFRSGSPPGGNIPKKFSCEGENISPQLNWKGAPAGTQAFALVVHDPDAPHPGGYTHWVVYNIPAGVSGIPENAPHDAQLPGGGAQGKNDEGKPGYTGPCPPSGIHHYHFYLYALDSELDLSPGATAQDLDKAMEGHIVGKTELVGTYRK